MAGFVDNLLRSRTSAGAESARQDNAVSDAADHGLDMAMEGLSMLHAAIDHLSSQTGEEPTDGKAPQDVEGAFAQAVDALSELREAVDEALEDEGLPPTTADSAVAEYDEDE